MTGFIGARVSRPASAAIRQWPACYPDNDPSPNQAGLETRASKRQGRPRPVVGQPAGLETRALDLEGSL
ncbi:MAG TPA: hypothetical protein VN837_07210 [Chloroflexota bacterium]|nr:hypothetical protein [Chloroflexota bacterium]